MPVRISILDFDHVREAVGFREFWMRVPNDTFYLLTWLFTLVHEYDFEKSLPNGWRHAQPPEPPYGDWPLFRKLVSDAEIIVPILNRELRQRAYEWDDLNLFGKADWPALTHGVVSTPPVASDESLAKTARAIIQVVRINARDKSLRQRVLAVPAAASPELPEPQSLLACECGTALTACPLPRLDGETEEVCGSQQTYCPNCHRHFPHWCAASHMQ